MAKMNAILFERTGHVLGVVTRASQPEKAATAAEVAAGGYKLRDLSNVQIDIAEDEVSVELVDYDTRVLYRPSLFAFADGLLEEQAGIGGASVTLDGATIVVVIPTAVSESTDVWCQVAGGALSETLVISVAIDGTETAPLDTGSEALTLLSGTYTVAMFAPGFAAAVFSTSVP